jgi:hypothetical protein
MDPQALKIVLNGVLLEEKLVCEIIFESSKNLKDECFAETAKAVFPSWDGKERDGMGDDGNQRRFTTFFLRIRGE